MSAPKKAVAKAVHAAKAAASKGAAKALQKALAGVAHVKAVVTKPLKKATGSMQSYRSDFGGNASHNARKHSRVQTFDVDELWCDLSAPNDATLNLLAYGNIQPGLMPLNSFVANSTVAGSIVPGIGNAAIANINPITNNRGFCRRTATQAVCYDKWCDADLEMVYEPSCTGLTTQGSAGEIILHAEPDVVESWPTTSESAIRAKWSTTGRPCDKLTLKLPRDFFRKREYYLRAGPITFGSSVADYDGGRFHVMCNGVAGTGLLGRVTIRGTVKMFDDVSPLEATALQVPPLQSLIFGMAQSILPTTNGSNSQFQLLSIGDVVDPTQLNGANVYNTGFTQLVLPPGNYGLDFYMNPSLQTNTTGIGTSNANIGIVIATPNANAAIPTVLNDAVTLNQNSVGAVSLNVTNVQLFNAHAYWRNAVGQNTVLTVTVTTAISSTGLGTSPTVAFGQVANNFTGAALSNATTPNALGAIFRVYRI